MKKVVSATEARVHFGEVLRSIAEDGATYVIERGGKPEAVVISVQTYDRLTSASDSGSEFAAALRASQNAFRPVVKDMTAKDIVNLIREGREARDRQIDDAVFGR